MGLWHFLVTSLENPEDSFRIRLRKAIIGVMFFPTSFFPFAYTFRGFATYTAASQLIAIGLMMGLAWTFIISYIWMRWWRSASDTHMAATLWSTVFFAMAPILAFPEFDFKTVLFAMQALGVMSDMPGLLFFLMFTGCQMFVVDWNAGSRQYPEEMWTLPDPRIGTAHLAQVAGFWVGSLVLAGVLKMFYGQVLESERRAVAQTAANDMTFRVLMRQRKYNTDDVTKILEGCVEEKIVDPKLIALFGEMNRNLESYRPFLPNYLFQDEDDEEEGGEEGGGGVPLSRVTSDGGMMGSMLMVINNYGEEDDQSEGELSRVSSAEERSVGGGEKGEVHPMRHSARRRTIASRLGDTSSRIPGDDATLAVYSSLNKRGALFMGRITFATLDICADRLAPVVSSSVEGGFDSHLSTEVLSTMVNYVYKLAKETKASVHSMLGDTVQLTWNATSHVLLPETKGAVFLARLSKLLQGGGLPPPITPTRGLGGGKQQQPRDSSRSGPLTAAVQGGSLLLPVPSLSSTKSFTRSQSSSSTPTFISHSNPMTISGAVCSGTATIHNITSNHQQALIIEAPWLPSLEGIFDLAKQHAAEARRRSGGSHADSQAGVVLMDERTQKASQLEVDSCAVEQLSYSSSSAVAAAGVSSLPTGEDCVVGAAVGHSSMPRVEKWTFLCHHPFTTPLLAGAGASLSGRPNLLGQSSRNKNVSSSVVVKVYQIIGEKVRGDDEWMYQLQEPGEEEQGEEGGCIAGGSSSAGKGGGSSSGPTLARRREQQARAITAVGEGRFGEALPILEAVGGGGGGGTSSRGVPITATMNGGGMQSASSRSVSSTYGEGGGYGCGSQHSDKPLAILPPSTLTTIALPPPPPTSTTTTTSSVLFTEALTQYCQEGMLMYPPAGENIK